jgi:hypothetical protein
LATASLEIPLGGILEPLQPLSVNAVVFGQPVVITLGGTPVGGIVPTLVNSAPEKLANAIKAH